ncbi:sigma-70 family RNA polymerase sigma factor [Ligilactobacillus sp. WILCCON 0076]|uniref:Sigma-70 family RNA polymerase sigma factor n=1 Tax=Ligilactobacillus ubinensis TaxID=2876789 RepID=A0A9X2FKF8_9LACO|nr:sigma-70 family RNA polymerase sigma factor [Ligilactobacillus ubinensis]MCP0887261.1 sigma-70 family RNA polymerase sigma factor [Ligilactobacillus ubinensis]
MIDDTDDIKELIRNFKRFQTGDMFNELFTCYRPLVATCINYFKFSYLDIDDLIQEARIICYQTVMSYQNDMEITYGVYFKRCLLNQYHTLLRYENARKRGGKEKDVSLDNLLKKKGEDILEDDKRTFGIEDFIVLNDILNRIPNFFSKIEFKVFQMHLIYEYTPKEISEMLKIPLANVYNAIYRYKNKLNRMY